jgi:hypothetical protein
MGLTFADLARLYRDLEQQAQKLEVLRHVVISPSGLYKEMKRDRRFWQQLELRRRGNLRVRRRK